MDVKIVLGLLSSKTSGLDNEVHALDCLQKVASLLPKERLYLSR
ncbi:hypothetical protein NXS10_04375 [Streptococcus sp. SQ9-PEA]|uniref:NADPH-dependent FMN reductase-like domain-containing protein n=1 Tax=Streptococcus sciuri TaxID=2973939 RepID=A0ABT2F6V8_9STRE|nr:hypothetical protein [Streptococcus sciuri]MCS4488193.1 hypothetical protein [Streptococcus sciuri]